MRVNRTYGSEGGRGESNRPSRPLSMIQHEQAARKWPRSAGYC